MASYHQFTQFDRIMLSALKRKGFTQADIARELVKDQSAVSRELQRNSRPDGSYHAGDAGRNARSRRDGANDALRRIRNDPWLARYIVAKLRQYWSPEQISGRVRRDHGVVVCHETIYHYIYDEQPEFKRYLRCRKGRYRRRYGLKQNRKQRNEAKKVRIDRRPVAVEKRARVCD